MSTYAVKETFRTLQGEGRHAGRAAVFLRFSRCNLWSGHEKDRATAICQFCDTEFVGTDGEGGGVFRGAEALADHVADVWGSGAEHRFVVCTGGEPALQLDAELVDALHASGFEIAIETNGTLPLPDGIDWVCMSPKAGTEIVVTAGDECKVVFPQEGLDPADFESMAFANFLLSPMDGPDRAAATAAAIEYCLEHPRWRLSVQTHKVLGIP
ncbi:7-carboxy-7-deazaguanine synthase [Actinospongicola halichondriae]|uniref:7-carboxy-7-deazaguanine synthase n=1 Tax=Actinospongicola halichondriae TaxID=3236844 RepID=UPI003D569941